MRSTAVPWKSMKLAELLTYEQPGKYLVASSQFLSAGRVPVLTAGKTFVLGYTNDWRGVYTKHPVIIFDDFTTASKFVDFDFKAKSSAMKILSARPGVADIRFVYERMHLIDFPLGDHKRYWISEYSHLLIEVPAIDEQAALAAVISDLTQQVDALTRMVAKKNAIKQGMMQQLLTGKTRLPGFTEPWKVMRLGDMGNCLRGVGYDPKSDLSTGDRQFTIRLLRSNNVQDGALLLDDLQFVHQRRVKPQQRLRTGDIVICMANGSRVLVGKTAYFDDPGGEVRYTFGAFMGAFRTRTDQSEPRFIAQLLKGKNFRDWLDLILAGSSINNIRPGDVEDFKIAAPCPQEQAAIADALGDVDSEIEGLQNRRAKAKAVKLGVMQELLTGRSRLLAIKGAS